MVIKFLKLARVYSHKPKNTLGSSVVVVAVARKNRSEQ